MALMRQPVSLILIAVLALVQGVLGVMRSLEWFRFGADVSGQGVLVLPLVGLLAVGRGIFVASIAILYVLFAVGSFLGRGWAWWIGLWAALINLLLVVSALAQEDVLGRALPWAIVPVILVVYLLAPAGRRALRG